MKPGRFSATGELTVIYLNTDLLKRLTHQIYEETERRRAFLQRMSGMEVVVDNSELET